MESDEVPARRTDDSRREITSPRTIRTALLLLAAEALCMDDLPRRIDHTVLGPTTTPSDVDRVVDEALEFGTNVCVPACYVARVRERLDASASDATDDREADDAADDPNAERDAAPEHQRAPDGAPRLVTVVGFPHGQHEPTVLRDEARRAEAAGADELDVVANAGLLLAGEDEQVGSTLAGVVDAVDVPVKAIVSAPVLDREQLRRAGEAAAAAGCSHAKTATGFGEGGATVADVSLLAEYLPVKASGGIGSWEQARDLLDAGATRIGASSGDVIVREWCDATE